MHCVLDLVVLVHWWWLFDDLPAVSHSTDEFYALVRSGLFQLVAAIVRTTNLVIVAVGFGSVLLGRPEFGSALPEKAEPPAAVLSARVIEWGEPPLVGAHEELCHVRLFHQERHDVRVGRGCPEGVVERSSVVVVPDRSAGQADLIDEKPDHLQVPASAGDVENGFPEAVAGVAPLRVSALPVKALRSLEVVGTDGIEYFGVVSLQHGSSWGKKSGLAVLLDGRDVAEAVGFEGGPRVVGGFDTLKISNGGFVVFVGRREGSPWALFATAAATAGGRSARNYGTNGEIVSGDKGVRRVLVDRDIIWSKAVAVIVGMARSNLLPIAFDWNYGNSQHCDAFVFESEE